MKLFRQQILLISAITLLVGVAQASEACNTITECQKLRSQANEKIQNLLSNSPKLEYFVRDSNAELGIVTTADQNKADQLCKAGGGRLPTARELAIDGVKHGSEILELNQVTSGKVPKGFSLVSVVNPDGKKDEFYYRYKNYGQPQGDVEGYFLHSSSVHSLNKTLGYGRVRGSLDFNSATNPNGVVRCIGFDGYP